MRNIIGIIEDFVDLMQQVVAFSRFVAGVCQKPVVFEPLANGADR